MDWKEEDKAPDLSRGESIGQRYPGSGGRMNGTRDSISDIASDEIQ